MEIPTGVTHTISVMVDHTNVASAVGSGFVEVFATPMMIALMEKAASACIKTFLDEGMASVGTEVNVSHSGATPIGMKVFATAMVTLVDRRRVEFAVEAHDECGEIGKGTHTRFVVDVNKFMAKARERRGPSTQG